jgi:xanthine dehydrogenase accessory factor
MENIYFQVLKLHSDKIPLILATVTHTNGSTPQKPGSSAIFGKSGLISGTIGGGIVEGKIQKIAIESLKSKKSGHYIFNLSNDISNKEEAICGGEINILVDANISNSVTVFKSLKDSIERKIPGVLITMVTRFDKEIVLINRYWISSVNKPELPPEFAEKINPIITDILKSGKKDNYREAEFSSGDEEPSSVFFFEPVFPLPQLIIAGAGHIGRSLASLGSILGFEVTVIDDRRDYANSENIPSASHIIVDDIGTAMNSVRKSDDTYVVIVTRGHKDDAAALKECIGKNLAYTGMIGSRNKISAMRHDFIENGWATPEQWSKIFAPVGIDIKSQTVEEIAVSIAAQLVLEKNSRKSEVRSRKTEVGSYETKAGSVKP